MEKDRFRFKRADLAAYAAVLLLVAAALALTFGLTGREGEFAVIYMNGEELRRVPLSVDQTFSLHGDYCNEVTVKDGRIAVTHSTCPNQDCVRQGWLGDQGGSIICLPNRVEIRVVSSGEADIIIR